MACCRPGGDLRDAWIPIFGPLALLAWLDAVLVGARPRPGYEVTVVRGGAALFAAGALTVSLSPIPAAVALWLGLSPLLFVKLRSARAVRRMLEVFIFAAALVAGFADPLQDALVGHPPAVGAQFALPWYAWCITAALVAVTAFDGILRPEAEQHA